MVYVDDFKMSGEAEAVKKGWDMILSASTWDALKQSREYNAGERKPWYNAGK